MKYLYCVPQPICSVPLSIGYQPTTMVRAICRDVCLCVWGGGVGGGGRGGRVEGGARER